MTREIDEHIRQHYMLEKNLAQRILKSAREDRTRVAIEAYDELFSSIPWHPLLNFPQEKEQRRLAEQRIFFEHLVGPDSDILDIGAGTGYWIRYLAGKTTGRCVGVDVSEIILTRRPDDPPNLELYIADATELRFPADSFDVVFSSQLIEHLHPDDIERHFASVWRVLREKGVYAFDTPSRLDGPHDVSKYFDEVATGFHLKEWTYRELVSHLVKVGFRKIHTMVLPWRMVERLSLFRTLGTVPAGVLIPAERVIENIRHKRLRCMLCKLFRIIPIYLIAQK